MQLLARVRRFLAQNGLFHSGSRVVVAVSGGSDSVALAHVIAELHAAAECRVAGVAHFNHQLRATADRDEQFTRGLAESCGWPVIVGREDVRSRSRREHRSIEDAAHAARHEFFDRACAELNGDVVALGHTRDDQAETFLLRLLRGAGPKGLASMHPRHGFLVRPLLSCRRVELRAYLDRQSIPYVEDESNLDPSVPRNRIRAELLPLLERDFNPAIVDVLADEALLLREIWDWIERGTADARSSAAGLDVAELTSMPPPLRRWVLWRAMQSMSHGRPVLFRHVEAGLDLLRSSESRSIDGPGHRLERVGEKLVLTRREPGERIGSRSVPVNAFDYPLRVPGQVQLPAGIVAAEPDAHTVDPALLGSNAVAVRRDRCLGQLRVRNRRPGDRFQPIGLIGRKKLQDYFVDRKVARRDRDGVPIVVDESDRIVWVAGFGIDEAFRVTDPAQAVLILKFQSWGRP
jgi:tRNA(Ile)-lysidine synthase